MSEELNRQERRAVREVVARMQELSDMYRRMARNPHPQNQQQLQRAHDLVQKSLTNLEKYPRAVNRLSQYAALKGENVEGFSFPIVVAKSERRSEALERMLDKDMQLMEQHGLRRKAVRSTAARAEENINAVAERLDEKGQLGLTVDDLRTSLKGLMVKFQARVPEPGSVPSEDYRKKRRTEIMHGAVDVCLGVASLVLNVKYPFLAKGSVAYGLGSIGKGTHTLLGR